MKWPAVAGSRTKETSALSHQCSPRLDSWLTMTSLMKPIIVRFEWGDMHMVAVGLSCQSAMVGTVWANSCPGCMDRL